MPMVPNAPNTLLMILFFSGIHTPTTNKKTDTIPIGFSKLIRPVISCTPFKPPYWFSNIGNRLITNDMVKEMRARMYGG